MKEQRSAVVVDISGIFAAVLTNGGDYLRIPNKNYQIGQTVLLDDSARTAHKRARMSALASLAAVFLLLFFGGFSGYVTPAGVVSLDVNPSIEYTINCFDRVLDIDAVNGDGEQILEGMDEQALLYRRVDDAVDATIVQLQASGYLTEAAENDVVLSASSYSLAHAEQIAERLEARVAKRSELTVYAVSVEKADVNDAHEIGTSAGKLYLIEKLGETIGEDESFNPKDWVEKPVREIIAETKNKPNPQQKNEMPEDASAMQTPDAQPGNMGGGLGNGTMPNGGQSGADIPNDGDIDPRGQGAEKPAAGNGP